jgi:hypothetical protein
MENSSFYFVNDEVEGLGKGGSNGTASYDCQMEGRWWGILGTLLHVDCVC